jgi:lathosterol oxidase
MMLISLIGAASVVALLERFARLRLRPLPFLRAFFFTDLFYLLTGFIAGGSIAVAYVTRSSQLVGEVFSIPRLTAPSLPLWCVVILALLALDGGNYAAHYCLHRFNALWEFHKVHHSSRELDWLATFRSHIGEQILRRPHQSC